MLIFIPSTQYTVAVEGSVIKDVTCESCGQEYSYTMSRVASGVEKVLFSSSRGPEKALEKAKANLAKVLEAEHNNVPCPACKWHQAEHVAYVRSRSYPQLKNLAGAFFIFAALILGLILFFSALIFAVKPNAEMPEVSSILGIALFVLAVASPGLLLRGFRSLLLLGYQPNASAPDAAPATAAGTGSIEP